jgi:hypothetical protein
LIQAIISGTAGGAETERLVVCVRRCLQPAARMALDD